MTGGAKEQNAVAGKYDPGAAPPLPPDGTAHHGRAVPENDLDAVRGQPLAQALSAAGAQVAADPQPVQTQLTVVEDPAWAQVPDALSGPLLLVAADSPLLSSWTDTLAERGYYRDFSWKNRGRTQPAALYRQADVLPAPQALAQGYEQELDSVRENLARAQHQLEEQDAQLQRLRSDLSLSRSHEQQLENALAQVTGSKFWKITWPARYLVSKTRQVCRTFPPFVFLASLRRLGLARGSVPRWKHGGSMLRCSRARPCVQISLRRWTCWCARCITSPGRQRSA